VKALKTAVVASAKLLANQLAKLAVVSLTNSAKTRAKKRASNF
jgi:hypothetical protein